MAPSDQVGGDGAPPARVKTRRRSLRAVFAADIAGFSGKMSLNETSAVSSLSEIRVVGREELNRHNGWLFGMPGDGLFALFESAVSAVQCALDIQKSLAERPHLSDMPLRIGIHLGEVLIDNELPFGEALNIAARLEALAEPGGILVSGPVMDAVSARVSATFEDRGVPRLKNIPRRISTYAVKPPPARPSADQAQSGLSNLDRTTRFDRNALSRILDEEATFHIVTRNEPPNAGEPVSEAQPSEPARKLRPSEPVTDTSRAGAEADVGNERAASAVNFDVEAPVDLARAARLPRAVPDGQDLLLDRSDGGVHGKDCADARSDPLNRDQAGQLADEPDHRDTEPAPTVTSSSDTAVPNSSVRHHPPEHQPPAEGMRPGHLSDITIEMITKSLAVHLGPFAKLIVERHMKHKPGVDELVAGLEEHIPNVDERMVFRVRVAQILKAFSKPSDDDQ